MDLVIVCLVFKVVNGLLPICRQNVLVIAIESLTDLRTRQ